MGTGDAALLAELDMPGGQPGEKVDQIPEPDRPQPRPGPHDQRHGEQAAPRAPQPVAGPAHPRHRPRRRLAGRERRPPRQAPAGCHFIPADAASTTPGGSAGHWPSGISPAAAANASSAAATADCWPVGSLAKMPASRAAPTGGRLLHHLPARRGDRNLHGPAIGAGPMPADQALTPQPVTHPPRRRGGYRQRRGQVRYPLRAPRRKHHQRPVLSDRDVLRRRAQGSGDHRHQGSARRQHRVHRGLVCHVLSHASRTSIHLHIATSAYRYCQRAAFRIGALGTNGIQATDLVTRRLTMHGGGLMADFLARLAATDVAPGPRAKPWASTRVNVYAAVATLRRRHRLPLTRRPGRGARGGNPVPPDLRDRRRRLADGPPGRRRLGRRHLPPSQARHRPLVLRAGSPPVVGLLAAVTAASRDLLTPDAEQF